MCEEDVRIALRRSYRYTAVNPVTGPVTFRANGKRVLFRASVMVNLAVDASVSVTPSPLTGNQTAIGLNTSNPQGELSLEKHGPAVSQEYVVTSPSANTVILEVFDDELGRIMEGKPDPKVKK